MHILNITECRTELLDKTCLSLLQTYAT